MFVLNSLQDPQLIELLAAGKVGIIPTDTIYGLCAVASNREAVGKMYEVKNRDQKPGTLIAANIEQLIELGIDEPALRAVAHVWPGPISIVLPAPDRLAYLHLELASLAVRILADETLRHVLEVTGALVTTSANHPGEPPANNLADAERYFADAVDFYVEGGDLGGRPPSTVARYVNGTLEVLRPGAFRVDEGQSVAPQG